MKQTLLIVVRSIAMIFAVFIATSIFDLIISSLQLRAYGNVTFIVIFGLGGIFAGLLGYTSATGKVPKNDRTASIGVVVMQVIIGALFFFLIARIEGGEYEVPFKAFGVMLALSSLVFLGKSASEIRSDPGDQ